MEHFLTSMVSPAQPARLIAEFRTVAVSLAAVDRAEKAGSRFERAEMNDLGGLALHFSGDSGSLRESRAALDRVARRFQVDVALSLLDNPAPAARPAIDLPSEFQPLLNQLAVHVPEHDSGPMKAIGILETQGFTAITAAADAATKAADVALVAREKLGGGYVAIVVEGEVAAVEAAVSAGRRAAESFQALIASEVISRPSEGVGRLLATCALPEGKRA
jgi:ethanolamine utilization microcompartment shell protein EutS